MISLFSKRIKDTLTELTYIERMPDLPVQSIVKEIIRAEGQEYLIRIPEGLSQVGYEFKYDVMWLSSKEKMICYLEDWGTQVDGDYLISKFRLIGHCDLKKYSLVGSADNIILEIMDKMPQVIDPVNGDAFSRAFITFEGITEKTPAIFSRYSLDEHQKQILMYPYDYFALNYSIKYKLNPSCINTRWTPIC